MASYNKSRQAARKIELNKKEVQANTAKRAENLVRIRKQERINNFQKRRVEGADVIVPSTNPSERRQEFAQLIQDVNSFDPSARLDATMKMRKLLSVEHNPPIQELIDAGVGPRLVEFLTYTTEPQLQFEACWALTNIASGSSQQTRYLIELGEVPLLRVLLSSNVPEIKEQAAWNLGNIAGDSPQCRDYVLSQGVMEPLLALFNDKSSLSILRNATWSLSNLCRGKPQPSWQFVSPALPTLSRLLLSSDDEILTDACWALSYLSDGPNERIQAILESGIARRIVELLEHSSFSVLTPTLRLVGNIVTGDDQQTQLMINLSLLPRLLTLLDNPRKAIRKEACWTISNITAGTKSQVQAVIDARIFPRLISLLSHSDFEIKKEAAWAISNATSCGSPEQVRSLIDCGILDPLCDLLSHPDSRLVLVALEALENSLSVGEKDAKRTGTNEVANSIEECLGLDKLEQLQNHQNQEVYEKTVKILEKYFSAEEDEQNISPNINSGAFSFGVSTNASAFNF